MKQLNQIERQYVSYYVYNFTLTLDRMYRMTLSLPNERLAELCELTAVIMELQGNKDSARMVKHNSEYYKNAAN